MEIKIEKIQSNRLHRMKSYNGNSHTLGLSSMMKKVPTSKHAAGIPSMKGKSIDL